MMLLLRVPDNGSYMLAAYAITAAVLATYALRLMRRTRRED